MPVRVIIPTPLRAYAGKRDSTEVKAATVGEALGHLTTQFGDLRKHLFTEDGKLRSFVNVYVNDEDIRYLAKENTPTKDGDTISIVPSIAGGSPPSSYRNSYSEQSLRSEETLPRRNHLGFFFIKYRLT